MYTGTEASKQNVGGMATAVGMAQNMANQAIPRDMSPIEQQFKRQVNLMSELDSVIHALTESIKPVMRYDPRESPQPVGAAEAKTAVPSCAVEAQIDAVNNSLIDKIRLLSQVRETVCL